MANTIWKYNIGVDTTLEIPGDGQVLSVQVQDGSPGMWVLVDPTRATRKRFFRVYPTGGDAPVGDSGAFVGTFQLKGGSLVYHLFELR